MCFRGTNFRWQMAGVQCFRSQQRQRSRTREMPNGPVRFLPLGPVTRWEVDCYSEGRRKSYTSPALDQGAARRDLTVKGWTGFNSLDWSADGKGFFIGNLSGGSATLLYVDQTAN